MTEPQQPEPQQPEPEGPALSPSPGDAPAEVPGEAPSAHTPLAPVPSPALFARSHSAPSRAAFGRVAPDGVVFVRTADGEREVGSFPGASPADALAYFGRKYDDLVAAVDLLHQRVTQTEMPVKEAQEALARLREQVAEARVVGDLALLDAKLVDVDAAVTERRTADARHRAEVKAAAAARRAELVAAAERIASQPEQKIQWKSSGARLRELLEEWKEQQRSGPRLDKDVEAALWQRFSHARNAFDRMRRAHFAELDSAQADAREAKERLVAEAERLATSRDWAATASSFKRLMDEWRRAGRASRSEDDALWERFKTAQDSFFAAKDAVYAAEDQILRANLAVKESLVAEATALLPVKDLDGAKAALRVIQDKWDKAGKVPRADMERIEKALRRVEQAVRDAEERRWSSFNPEALARAQSLVQQLERAVAGLQAEVAKAEQSGQARTVQDALAALQVRQEWLEQARAGLREFGPTS